MADFKISGNMKVKTLKERFQDEFNLFLIIYKKGEIVGDHLSISEIRAEHAKGGELKARKNTLIKNLESIFEKQFGITVQIFSPDGKEAVPKDKTLQQVIEMYAGDSGIFESIFDEKEGEDLQVSNNQEKKIFLFVPRDTSDNLNDEDYGFDDIALLDDDPEEHPEVFSIMFSYICDLATNLIKAIEGNAFSGKYYAVLEDGDGKKNIIFPLFELPNSREKIPQESMEEVLTGEKFCIAVVVNPDEEEENIEDHWFSFYQVSEEYSGAFTAYGPFPPYKLARQIYDRGEPDTGIMEDSDDLQYTEKDSFNQPYVDLTEKITKFHNRIGENNSAIKG